MFNDHDVVDSNSLFSNTNISNNNCCEYQAAVIFFILYLWQSLELLNLLMYYFYL